VQAFCYIADRHSPRELIMSGEYKTHIAAILKAAERIEESTRGMTKATFARDEAAVAGVREELSRIGRAVGDLSEKIRRRYPEIGWEAVARVGRSDGEPVLDGAALWDYARQDVPAFVKPVRQILFDITD
jgi:uncharacterized protein with HEPN domain